MATRKIGTGLGTVTIGGTALAADCENARFSWTVKTAEGKAAQDTDDWPVPTGRGLEISGRFMCSGTIIQLMGTVNSSNPVVSFALNTGAGTVGGSAVITRLEHAVERDGIQAYDMTLVAQGAVSYGAS